MVTIQDWALAYGGHAFSAPESTGRKLVGRVFGHPSFPDGYEVETGRLISFDLDTRTARTRNTEYRLGKVHADYAAYCVRIGKPIPENLLKD